MPVYQPPGVSEKRLSLTPNGNVRYQLKTPYRDGTTHVIFEPLDDIAWSDLVGIDIGACAFCGGPVRVIACIEDADVIEKILTHLDTKGPECEGTRRPPSRGLPQRGPVDATGLTPRRI